MKEYNWREERKTKYSNNSPVNGNNVGGCYAPPASNGSGKTSKIIGFLVILAILGGAGFYYFNKKSAALPQIPNPTANHSKKPNFTLPEITVHYKNGHTDNEQYGILNVYEPATKKRLRAQAVPETEWKNHKHNRVFQQLKNNAINTLKFFFDTFNYRSYDNNNGPYRIYYTIKNKKIDPSGKIVFESVNNAFEMATPLGYGKFDVYFAFSPEHIGQDTITHEFTHAVTEYRINDGDRISLMYKNHSGALHESFSDIFACLQHIEANPKLPKKQRWNYSNGSRNHANPGAKKSYAGVGYPSYYKQNDRNGMWIEQASNGRNDNGFVHHNMTVLGKFAYLICEGDTFRGYKIKPMGHVKTRKLFWQLQDSKYIDVAQHFDNLADKIIFAANDANFDENDLINIKNACLAINLPINPEILKVFDSIQKQNNTGKFAASFQAASMAEFKTSAANVQIKSEDTFRNLFKGEEIGKIFVKQNSSNAGSADNVYKYAARNVSTLPDAFSAGSSKYYQTTQCVSSIPVFASSAVVGVDHSGEVTRFSKNFSSRAKDINITLKPFPDSLKNDVLKNQQVRNVSNYIFDPALLRMKGSPSVVWMVDTPSHRYLIDQKSEKVVYDYPLVIKD